MQVRGLCVACNNLAGSTCDAAYADFAAQIRARRSSHLDVPSVRVQEPPFALFAPNLVARSVLMGMFAIAPLLRTVLPEVAHDLLHDPTAVRWPGRTRLVVGMTDKRLSRRGLLTSGHTMMQVMTRRALHSPLAEIVFPPLVWALVPRTSHAGLGPEITAGLADASDWVRYSPDRTSVDLRDIVRILPVFVHPLHTQDDDWVELTGDHTVLMHGALPD